MTNSSNPPYFPLSDFDFQSLNLALNQEWIELDLFHHGLAMFSDDDFDQAGIGAEERFLIQHMADQEVEHAQMLTNVLQGLGAKQCNYTYDFTTVHEFVDFCHRLTRWGEAGVYGFIEHLNSRAAATLLVQSITVEARQEMVFRQLEGLSPMPESFSTGITQSMAWSLLSRYISSCPAENPRIEWPIFPGLNVSGATPAFDNSSRAAITTNHTAFSTPGQNVSLSWEMPGMTVSYNNSYNTSASTKPPLFAAWISQVNTTYTPLENINGTTATTMQPNSTLFPVSVQQVVNSTMFIVITDDDIYVTPYNLSAINDHIIAGPAVYIAG
ncbi:hypothetical protein ONZ45_g14365 [Pleurotus djamor]|nr:hypothetical protein ONZ45_g14365 [Pleurotus djamor]